MGKLSQGINTAALRTGNTIATPLRIGGELANALANVPRQGISSAKNIAEVTKQTRDALIHNFTDFSKVEGKRYQKMLKVPLNLASAVTRRPAMIAASGVASGLNQGAREPFKKLLFTPGKMFKGMRNATRIFSKKKGFDFQSYDTHETKGDTRVNHIKEKNFGFLGAKTGLSPVAENEKAKGETPKIETPKKEEKKIEEPKKIEAKPEEIKKPEAPKKEEKKPEEPKKPEIKQEGSPTPNKSIDDVKKQKKEESEKKDKEEQKKNFPERKTLDKKQQIERKKEYDKLLKNNLSEQGIIARGKEAKMGENIEDILKNFKEKDPTFVGYMEEILARKK